MSCIYVRNSLSAHLDGLLPEAEARRIASHLTSCTDCARRWEQMGRVRTALRKLPSAVPPARLMAMLRVAASQDRARKLSRANLLHYYIDRLRFWMDGLMRPFALPFAGGLVSAVALFAMLVPIGLQQNYRLNDVPVALFTEPAVKETPFEFDDSDLVLEVIVDRDGRMVDYSIMGDKTLPNNSQLRRSIENSLLFTTFTPATFFGSPTMGRMYISFSHRSINIKS
jgi:hypothetical protein